MKLLLALAFLCGPAAQEKTAKDLLGEALKQAGEGKKRVLLTFGAPG
jgi:hypothetical protein